MNIETAMTIFLILAPYAAFAILMVLTSATVSLFVSAAICLAVIAYDAIGGRSLKLLGTGSAFVFIALGLYIILIDSTVSSTQVKLTVDLGMLAISVGSLIMRRPFTLQYAREAVDAQTARRPEFVDEDERPHHRPLTRGQRAIDLEVPEVVRDRRDHLFECGLDGRHHCSPGALARIESAWTRSRISSPKAP